MTRALVLLLALATSGCAVATVENKGFRASAIALGTASATAGDCRTSDERAVGAAPGDAQPEETLRVESRGGLCAAAHGKRGSPGWWGTVGAAFGALAALMAHAL